MKKEIKLLVVEDGEDLLLLWKAFFRRLGYQAKFTHASGQALKEIKEGFVPDILMTDFHLPESTGLELIKQVRTLHPEVKFLLVTGTHFSDLPQALPSDVRWLLKPVSFGQLQQIIEDTVK